MRRCVLLLVTILFGAIFAAAQDAKPQPTPPDDVVRITTNLIQVDVIVTDSKGKVVTDLKPEEIEIFENGERQKITNFSFITTVREKVEKPKEKDPLGVPEPPKVLREQNVRRTFALVVDDLTLSFESAYYTRTALKKFVDEQMQDGDLVAIVRTGAGMGALQQFTADKRMLYAAIEKVKWNPLGSGGISAFAPIEPPLTGQEQTQAGGEEDDESPTGQGESLDSFRSRVFSTGTLGALRYVITGMSELPGRKSVILFSHGFRLLESDSDGTVRGTSVILDYLKLLVDQANRAAVTFYTIDPRGLQYTGLTAADNTGGMSVQQVNNATSARGRELSETQDGLKYLARETGGFAVVNNNDISGGVRRVIEDHSYYLVGYDPDTDTFDAVKRKFNRLDVKVLRPGVRVRYRSGFFNVADRERPEVAVAGPTTGSSGVELRQALISPFSVGGISLKLNALFGSDAKNGSFVRSVLHVDTSDMKFTDEPNGEKKVVFDVLAVSFGDNGRIVEQLGKSYTLRLPPAAYRQITERGFVYHFMFPVKKPGAYQYRVALRDTQGGRIGSASQFIEVPNIKKKRLTLSSIVIENLSEKDWNMRNSSNSAQVDSDPMKDTALRRIKLGSILRYGFEVYNAKLDAAKLAKLNTRIRVFRDGQMVLDGKQNALDLKGQTDMAHIRSSGAVAIGGKMQTGDYVLQIIVTDELAEKKKQIATQFIQFEVVE
ncbi:MAG: VWA domain-containing protein [Pyrinomonadaceae bacterium]